MRKKASALCAAAAGLLVTLPAASEVSADEDTSALPAPWWPRLGPGASPGINLQGYSGFVAYRSDGAVWGHGVAGGTLRARFGYLELGGFFEASDRIQQGSWTAVGGFAGAYLPFATWVDVEATLGVGSRTHRDDDRRYGPSGYSWSTPALLFRVGVSDRSGEGIGALRVGMEVQALVDLGRTREPWELVYERPAGIEPLVLRGTTGVGGTSVGLVFTLGFDFALTSSAVRRSPTRS
jgi:hypothetical protein